MSTLQTTNIKNASSASNNIVLDTAGNATVAGTMSMGSYLRNRIINGDMRIDQRNAGASVNNIVGAVYTLDRWAAVGVQASKFSVSLNAGSVTPPAGFTNYLGVTSLSAYSVLTGDYFSVNQYIEGANAGDFGWGTANAQSVTLSFWVRSSLTGTFGGAMRNSADNRSYPFTYTISSANTWEYKTITISGDTSGTWIKDTGVGIRVCFSLGAGATYTGTAGSWAGAFYNNATGATSVVGTNGATWYVTGVQLEPGTVATPFERRPYGQELALCQRYYQIGEVDFRIYAPVNGAAGVVSYLTSPMRSTPTAAYTSAASASLNQVGTPTISALNASTNIRVAYTASATGDAYYVRAFSLSAEL